MAVISPSKILLEQTTNSSMLSKQDEAIDAFIAGAPDAKKSAKKPKKEKKKGTRFMKGKKCVITVTLDPDVLDKLNDLSKSLGMTRTAMINMLIRKELNE